MLEKTWLKCIYRKEVKYMNCQNPMIHYTISSRLKSGVSLKAKWKYQIILLETSYIQLFIFLKNAGSASELFIKTKVEFRLFKELKRRYSELYIETGSGIDDESKIRAFNLDDMKIIIDDENIMSVIGEKVIKISKDEFLKRPVRCIKELLKR